MNLLVVSATSLEIRPFLDKLPLVSRPGEKFSRYRYKNITVDALVSGIGMVATAYSLGRQLALQHYDLAINAGLAGTFNKALPLGSVVQVVEDSIAELGAENGEDFLTVFELGLVDPDLKPYRGGRLINDPEVLKAVFRSGKLDALPKVAGITSNTVRGNAGSIERIRRIAPADLESMEGAAFFYGCMAEGIPCLQIRAVSNRVEERDKSAWELDLALKNLNRFLLDLLGDIQLV